MDKQVDTEGWFGACVSRDLDGRVVGYGIEGGSTSCWGSKGRCGLVRGHSSFESG